MEDKPRRRVSLWMMGDGNKLHEYTTYSSADVERTFGMPRHTLEPGNFIELTNSNSDKVLSSPGCPTCSQTSEDPTIAISLPYKRPRVSFESISVSLRFGSLNDLSAHLKTVGSENAALLSIAHLERENRRLPQYWAQSKCKPMGPQQWRGYPEAHLSSSSGSPIVGLRRYGPSDWPT
jgi:hypothetical protein